MGQTLSEPVTDKHSEKSADAALVFGASSMQGWRVSMEDAHTAILNLDPNTPESERHGAPDDLHADGPPRMDVEAEAEAGRAAFAGGSSVPAALPDGSSSVTVGGDGKGGDSKARYSFFAVYDGHGGQAVAIEAGKRVHWKIIETEEFKRGDYAAAMQQGFLAMDEELQKDEELAHDPSGCTAVTALIVHDTQTIYVANAGDSRAVMSVAGKAEPMSWDHKPGNQTEVARIIAAGGFVEFGRVNGNLALSRAIGDFEFKQNPHLDAESQIVTAFPDVEKRELEIGKDKPMEFLVLACDGIWDVMSNQDVVNFCRRLIAEGKELDKVCELLMDRCLAPDRRASELGGIGCDNMTVVIVGFLGGLTFEEWQKQIKERYEQDRLLRASQHDATDGSDDEYVTTDDDEPDSPVPQPKLPGAFAERGSGGENESYASHSE